MKTRREYLHNECVEFISKLKPDATVDDAAAHMVRFIELMIRELHELRLLHDEI